MSRSALPTALLLHPLAKPLLWLVLALPALGLVVAALTNRLGANPAEQLIHETGEWALRWLWLSLAITPLREAFKLPALVRFRRNVGVAAFLYGLMHLLCYAGFDKGWLLDDIVRDVLKRNFILVGMVAFVLMLPLALTSFNAAIRVLGGARWRWLHRLVYPVSLLVLLHFYWKKSAKQDTDEVLVYAAVLAILLGWRAMRAGSLWKWLLPR